MAYFITAKNKSLAKQINKNPIVAFKLEGLNTVFGSQPLLEFNKWDSNSYWDSDVSWDSLTEIADSKSVISLDQGTTNSITQQVYPDKASSGSVSSVTVSMVDLDNSVAKIFSLDNIEEILGKKADFYIGFKQGAFPQDAIPVFRGVVVDFYTENGRVVISIAHPDSLKRQTIYEQYLNNLTTSMDEITTIAGLDDWGAGLIMPVDTLSTYIQIDDEIMKVLLNYGAGVQVQRAQFGTIAASHSAGAEVTSIYQLTGNPIDLALKLMLSSEGNEFFLSDDKPKSISNNKLYFDYYDIKELTGLVIGDLVEIDDVKYTISGFEVLEDESTIILSEPISDVLEFSGVFKYKSQYNVLPDGLGMLPFNVDVQGHIDIKSFNPSLFVDYVFNLKETLEDAKQFIEEQIYFPQGLYSIPRSARASVKLITPPLSSEILPTLNTSNITNLGSIKQRRSVHKYLYNIYRFDYELDEVEDRYKKKEIFINNDSKTRIKVGNKVLKVESQGYRDNPSTQLAIQNIIQRMKERFSFAPTYFEGVDVKFGDSFNIEVGDIIPFGGSDTKIVNLNTGKRNQEVSLYEIINKSLNIKTGEVKIDLLKTSFNINARYAVVAPSSILGANNSTNRIQITKSYDVGEYQNESDKWSEFVGLKVRIRNDDYSNDEVVSLLGVDPQDNNYLLIDALSFTPSSGDIVEIPEYSDDNTNQEYKLLFAHFTFKTEITSVTSDSIFDVNDVSGLVVGSSVVISHPEFFNDSFNSEFKIVDITGSTVTLDKDLPFNPQIGYIVNNSNFKDNGFPYNII